MESSITIISDHPRLRGEKSPSISHFTLLYGSPPPARGEELPLSRVPEASRITPACAGRRIARGFFNFIWRDHPRLRGEKRFPSRHHCPGRGSPPPARGEDCHSSVWLFNSGITPACAGRSYRNVQCYQTGWDHPRLRGEKVAGWVTGITSGGSPPPARGEGKERN